MWAASAAVAFSSVVQNYLAVSAGAGVGVRFFTHREHNIFIHFSTGPINASSKRSDGGERERSVWEEDNNNNIFIWLEAKFGVHARADNDESIKNN